VTKKKGIFVDGHEREDVVDYVLQQIPTKNGIPGVPKPEYNAPTEEAKKALPADLDSPRIDLLENTVMLFYDESTFQANEDQPTLWAEKGTSVMGPKSKIMVSDFIDEKNATHI